MKKYKVTGALLYYAKGSKRKRLDFTTTATDLEALRDYIKDKHKADVVRLEYECEE